METELSKNEIIGVSVVYESWKAPNKSDIEIMEFVDLNVAQQSKDPASRVGGALVKD